MASDLDSRLVASLDEFGFAHLPGLLDARECVDIAALYDEVTHFRSRIIMSRHGFGQGEYQYFAYPLPDAIRDLRTRLYARLVPIANRWNQSLGSTRRFPATHREFLAQCHAAGQTRPTPLLLRYAAGDFNCLHQDLY